MEVHNIDQGLSRILVPFEELTTTVYVYRCDGGVALIDSASDGRDVEEHLLPALKQLGISHGEVRFLLLTHKHADHAGGLPRLVREFPEAKVGISFEAEYPNLLALKDSLRIFGDLRGIHLPGHTKDSFGFYDEKTRTLLSGDCLQLKGIGKYRKGITDPHAYLSSIEKLRRMELFRIVASHEYDPLGSVAQGALAVARYLDACESIARKQIEEKDNKEKKK